MAINVSFNGATIFKPGAYSKVSIDLGGGFPLSPTGLVAIFGESSAGAPGASVTSIANNVFSPDQLPLIKQTYGSGPIVDACNFLFAPGADGAIPGGAQAVYIYKTNASLRAQLVLASNWGTVQANEWGVGGNKITYKNTLIPASLPTTSSSAPINLTSGYFAGPGAGAPHLDDAEAIAAQSDAHAAYASLAARTFTTIPAILDGQSLSAGNYTEASGTFNLAASGAGALTLNGSATDVWVFKAASTLVTGAGGTPTITLTGGALASNVYWIVGSSATINSGHAGIFQGNVIAQASITDTSGGTVNGSMIALSGAVTDSAASIVNAQNSALLNSAGAFGILAASAVTGSAAGDTVSGFVGVSPGTSVTNFPPGTMSSGSALTLDLRVQGGPDNLFTAPGSVASVASLQAAFNNAGNWSLGLPSGISFVVSGSNAAASVAISMSSAGQGFGSNFTLVSGSLLGVGNGKLNINSGLVSSGAENQAMITLFNKRDRVEESAIVGGNIVLKIGRYAGGSVNPKVTVNAAQLLLINDSLSEYAINLSDFGTIAELVSFINSNTGANWTAQAASTLMGQLSPSVLDQVSNLGALSSSVNEFPAQIKKDASEVAAFFSQSAMSSLIQTAGQGVNGLPPAAIEQYLTGGALGASQTADMVNALTAFTKIHVNSVVPLFSEDAATDIINGLTDGASNYTIAGIHQAVKTHLSLMATTKKKSERQGYLSMKDSYVNCKAEIATMAEARVQMCIQDIRQVDSDGNIKWFLPWAGSALLAGARGGSPVGNPMTFKYFNMSGIRQTGQLISTPEANIVIDFDPDTQYDDAIASGVTFWEAPQTGGFRLVVDNTTYGKDGNWVYNRANVLYASDVLAYDFRNQLENIYVGLKNTVNAVEVSSTCQAILSTYLAQGITVSTSDAKNGFKQLVVQMNGNTINISVVVKLVEGIDFILADITLQRASQTA